MQLLCCPSPCLTHAHPISISMHIFISNSMPIPCPFLKPALHNLHMSSPRPTRMLNTMPPEQPPCPLNSPHSHPHINPHAHPQDLLHALSLEVKGSHAHLRAPHLCPASMPNPMFIAHSHTQPPNNYMHTHMLILMPSLMPIAMTIDHPYVHLHIQPNGQPQCPTP